MVHDGDVRECLRRLQERMEVRGLRPVTITVYRRCVRRFILHVGKPLDDVTTGEVEQYLLEQARQGAHPRTRNVILAALRFAFRASSRPGAAADIPWAKAPRCSPDILSGSEVSRLLAATTSPKYRAIFMLAYGAGLRVSELVALLTTDIDSERMLIHVREGKTGPRYVMMSPRVLEALRAYWRAFRPTGPRLFPGRSREAGDPHLTREAVHKVLAQGGPGGGNHQDGLAAHAAPHIRDASAGDGRRRADRAGAARPRVHREHGEVPTPDDGAAATGAEPARPDRDGARANARLTASDARARPRPSGAAAAAGRNRPGLEVAEIFRRAITGLQAQARARPRRGAHRPRRDGLSDGCARRPRGRVRGVRARAARVQLVPQPPLPQVSGDARCALGGGAGSTASCPCTTSTSCSRCPATCTRSRGATARSYSICC